MLATLSLFAFSSFDNFKPPVLVALAYRTRYGNMERNVGFSCWRASRMDSKSHEGNQGTYRVPSTDIEMGSRNPPDLKVAA